MSEPTLFDEPVLTATEAHTRRDDPETSHAAAASISVDALRESQRAVLGVLYVAPQSRAHHDALISLYERFQRERPDIYPRQSQQGIRSRLSELRDRGYVRDSGERVTLPSGRKSIVWEAVVTS